MRVVGQLLSVLIAFAVLGGTTLQLARSMPAPAPVTMAGMRCDMMMPSANTDDGTAAIRCKGMTPDCMKQMCGVDIGIPARVASAGRTAPLIAVAYWPSRSELFGRCGTPEPLPPRTT